MYKHRPDDFVIFERPEAIVNSKTISLYELSDYSCYMDIIDPLFSSESCVNELVKKGLAHSSLGCSCNDIRAIFQIDNDRFERPLKGMGNEIFKAMAAIGYSNNKELFCFPWLSYQRFDSYHKNMSLLLKVLEQLERTVIIPVGEISTRKKQQNIRMEL